MRAKCCGIGMDFTRGFDGSVVFLGCFVVEQLFFILYNSKSSLREPSLLCIKEEK